jgi:hypothetical protein
MLRQIAENVILVSGFSRSSLLVHFGATDTVEISPLPKLNNFVDAMIRDIPEDVREQAATFYSNVLSGVLRASHGTLAGVIPGAKRAVCQKFKDGIALSPAVSVSARIRDVLTAPNCSSNSKLQACSALITGMLLTDGITLFGSDGTVRAYNVFIKHPRGTDTAVGGARTRTFNIMRGLLGTHLVAALMLSQDGRVEYDGENQ